MVARDQDEGRRRGTRARRARKLVWAVWLAGVMAFAFALVAACLPDLDPVRLPDEDASSVPIALSACGDGLIETLDDGGDAGESCDPADAQPLGCEGCRITCPGQIDDAGHCYFVVDAAASFVAAKEGCTAQSAHLATFASEGEATFASRLVGEAAYWVGLVNDNLGAYAPPVSEPGYPYASNTCPGCFARGVDDAGMFAVHADAVDASVRACLVADQGRWFQVDCVPDGGRSYATLCEREPIGQRAQFCGGPFCTTLSATTGWKRYVIVLSPETSSAASAFCKEAYPGGSLVVLDSAEEREQLVREITALLDPPFTIWIGLSFDGGTWSWDLDSAAPQPWGNNQPSSSGVGRAFLRVDDRFDTQLAQTTEGAAAEARRAFVCQRPLE